MRNVNPAYFAWLCGFWEGEGTVFKRKSGTGWVVSISQSIDPNRTVESAMYDIQDLFGGSIDTKEYNNTYKTRLQWRIGRREEIMNFIKKIIFYSEIRKEQLREVLDWYRDNPDQRKRHDVNIDNLKDMLKEGKTYKQVGEHFGISASTVFKKCNRPNYN